MFMKSMKCFVYLTKISGPRESKQEIYFPSDTRVVQQDLVESRLDVSRIRPPKPSKGSDDCANTATDSEDMTLIKVSSGDHSSATTLAATVHITVQSPLSQPKIIAVQALDERYSADIVKQIPAIVERSSSCEMQICPAPRGTLAITTVDSDIVPLNDLGTDLRKVTCPVI